MKKAILYRYLLPMDSGVILREQRLTQREGLIIKLIDGDKSALAEIAPLSRFSHETLEQAITQTKLALERWQQNQHIDCELLLPSVAFGFSTAFVQLNKTLSAEGNYQTAPLCSGDPDELIEQLALMQGKKIAKIKVGLYEAIRDGITVNMLLEAIPELHLRLDANQQWTLEKAVKFASYIAPNLRSRIDFIEEPCQTQADCLEFAKQTGIRIAWDETTREPNFKLEAAEGVAAIVLKPTLIGSLERISALINTAHQLGLNVIISSSLESSIGLNQLARIAHWLTPDTLPGLDTLSLFSEQLELPWSNSTIKLKPLSECEILWQS